MRIGLLVGVEKDLINIFTINLMTFVGLEIILASNEQDAIFILENNPKIDLIISKSAINDHDLVKKIDDFLVTSNLEIPLIIIGRSENIKMKHTNIKEGLELKPLIKSAAEILGVTASTMVELKVPKYFPIPINLFSDIDNAICDIYKRINEKYQRIYSIESKIDNKDLENMIKEGVQHIYVPSENRLKCVSYINTKILTNMAKGNLEGPARIQVNENIMKHFKSTIQVEGFSTETIELANSAIESLENVAESEDQLGQLLKNLINNQTSYLYRHGQLITFLAFHALEVLHWDNFDQKKKMAFVSFFHDILLTTDELGEIENKNDFNLATLSDKDKELVETHARLASELIKNMPTAPIGTDSIILQHHGTRNGKGFVAHFGPNLAPLAIVFVVCEHLASKIIKQGKENIELDKILEELRMKFASSNYQKVLDTFKNLKL